MSWKFKSSIIYKGKKITADSRKFEILVQYYLNDNYPTQNWVLTAATRDNNHDLESICTYTGNTMWAEAKYTIHTAQNISSRKFDSTLVSSVDVENLIKIFFFSNCPIETNTIERVKTFFFYMPIKKVAFVDIYALEYWIKKNPEIETEFFEQPLKQSCPKTQKLNLKAIQIFSQRDSYHFDSCMETEKILPLYLKSNYIVDAVFEGYGLNGKRVEIFCNQRRIFFDKIPLEIFSVRLTDYILTDENQIDKEYPLSFSYKIDGKDFICDGVYKIQWGMLGHIFGSQLDCYKKITEIMSLRGNVCINLYGTKNAGKSYILKNIKRDLLSENNPLRKIIYIDFIGGYADLEEICRIIFTLIFDCDDLDLIYRKINSIEYTNSLKTKGINISFLKQIILYIRNKQYLELENILVSLFLLNGSSYLEISNYFSWEKIYLVDNYHLLSQNNKKIMDLILEQFQPFNKVTFVITNRTKISNKHISNIKLSLVSSREILDLLQSITNINFFDLEEVIPDDQQLRVPAVLNTFINNYKQKAAYMSISEYYFHFFSDLHSYGKEAEYMFNTNPIVILVYIIDEGIPYEFFSKSMNQKITNAVEKEIVFLKNGIYYPNISYKENFSSKDNVEHYKNEIIQYLLNLAQYDYLKKAYYLSILVKYFPAYYNVYFSELFQYAYKQFRQNHYAAAKKIFDVLKEHSKYYSGDRKLLAQIKYLLGFCNMHCNLSHESTELFEEVYSSYKNKPKDSLYFEAFSQIIDSYYWSFNKWNKIIPLIHKFRREWMCYSLESDLNPRAYLTSTNRMMVIYLALDKFDLAQKWFRKNIKLAVKYDMPEHIGYTLMDYAKGIYHCNLYKALQYLELALPFFYTTEEKRRYFDCLCELNYVKLLLGKITFSKFEKAQYNLAENQFWVQYFKSFIKSAVYFTIRGDEHEARSNLTKIRTSVNINNNSRVNYFITLLDSYLYQKRIKTSIDMISYGSYKKIWKHNIQKKISNKAILFSINDMNDYYYIDPRAW